MREKFIITPTTKDRDIEQMLKRLEVCESSDRSEFIEQYGIEHQPGLARILHEYGEALVTFNCECQQHRSLWDEKVMISRNQSRIF